LALNRTNNTLIAQKTFDSLTLAFEERNNQPAAENPALHSQRSSRSTAMATAAQPAPPATPPLRGVQPLRAGEGHSFFWRRLHSLTGIVPIGAFLVEHIISNFEAINGPLAYAQQVKFLNSLPLVRLLEWGFIFIPLAYHALYGVFIAIRGRSNVNVYPWAGNYMYLTQRITGIIALLYIAQHVWRQRFSGVMLPEHPGAAFAKVQHELANPWMLAIYVIAMIATTWHFAYGIWLFAAKWGITPGDKARKRFGYVCAVGGAGLCLMGLISIYAFVGPKYANAPEDVMPAQPPGITMPAPENPVPGSTNPSPSSLQQ
jgi:succinate dehydrogenase / fumarate reductase cytochrome b subunit